MSAALKESYRRRAETNWEWQTWHELDPDTMEPTGRTEERKRGILTSDPERRCTGTIRRGEWAGNRCVKPAVKGGKVCKIHGGHLPNVKKAAQRRLAMAADPAAKELIYIALEKPGVEDKDRIKALLAILDRAGIGGKETIEIEIKPWQNVLKRLAGKGKPDDEELLELTEGEFHWEDAEDG